MANTFEEVNQAHCFNHTLQLSARMLLKPFNAGMYSTTQAFEDNKQAKINDKRPMLMDNDAKGDNEGEGNVDGNEFGGDQIREDLDGNDEPEDSDSDGLDGFNQLDEEECERIMADTPVVRQTVTKVCSNPF